MTLQLLAHPHPSVVRLVMAARDPPVATVLEAPVRSHPARPGPVRSRLRARRLRRAFGAALLAPALGLALLPGASGATPTGDPAAHPDVATTADAVWQYQVRAVDADASELAAELLAAGYDVTARSGSSLFVLGDAASRTDLDTRATLTVVAATPVTAAQSVAGVTDDQDAVLPRRLDGNTYESYYGGYRTVDGFHAFEDDLAAAYPELVKVVDYGTSHDLENPLRAVCVTSEADQGCALTPDVDKARFLLMGQIHARELTTGEITWRLITALLDGDGKRPDITALLDETEIWVVPQANPDGIELTEVGIESQGTGGNSPAWQRKNLHIGSTQCGFAYQLAQEGVDLNRNFDTNWGGPGSSGDECDLTYRGTSAASEPETFELQELFRDLFEDQRGSGGAVAPLTTRGAMVSLHSYGNQLLFPTGSGAAAPNDAGLRSMAFRMSKFNGYQTGRPGEILYEVSGTTDDWSYEDLGIASFSYEIGSATGDCSGFFPAYSCQDAFYDLNDDALFYGMTAAQQPYTESLGPTLLTAQSSLVGSTVEITGTASDKAYGKNGVGRPASQPVTEARLFVGTPPWDGGVPQPMTVVGSGKRVTITGSLPATSERVAVYLQAKDADGNWGPTRVVWRWALQPA